MFDRTWDVLRNIRRTDAVPFAMLRSQGFAADGGNPKPGIGGKRVMHECCSRSVPWHSGIHGRAANTDRPNLAHGVLAHRSRECALTVAQQSQRSANELGNGCVLSNFDGTNAFGATRRDLLVSSSQQAAMEKAGCSPQTLFSAGA